MMIEDLNFSGMMKNRHLSKAAASQKLYAFKTMLEAKCKENGIEQRTVDRWFPPSKTYHCCKNIKKDLKLSDINVTVVISKTEISMLHLI